MSYEAVLSQIKAAPEACLDEISRIISYVVYRYEQETAGKEREPSRQLADAMLEALQISGDPSAKGYADTKSLFEDLNA